MAVSATLKLTYNVSTNSTSYTSTAFTPTAGRLLCCVFTFSGTVGALPAFPISSTGGYGGDWFGYNDVDSPLPGGIIGLYWTNSVTTASSTQITVRTNAGDGATGCNMLVWEVALESSGGTLDGMSDNAFGVYGGGSPYNMPWLCSPASGAFTTYTTSQTPTVGNQYPYNPTFHKGTFSIQIGTADVSSGFTLTPPSGWSSAVANHSAPTTTLYVAYVASASTDPAVGTSYGGTPSSSIRLMNHVYQFFSFETFEFDRLGSYGAMATAGRGNGGYYGAHAAGKGDGWND